MRKCVLSSYHVAILCAVQLVLHLSVNAPFVDQLSGVQCEHTCPSQRTEGSSCLQSVSRSGELPKKVRNLKYLILCGKNVMFFEVCLSKVLKLLTFFSSASETFLMTLAYLCIYFKDKFQCTVN